MKQSKGRKIGRNKKRCEIYRMLGTREINKAKRRIRHLRKHPGDQAARIVR